MSQSTSPRILTRGEESQFRVSFYADANQTVPLEPVDPSYPSYVITSPSGIPLQSGVGTMTAPGQYKANFTPAKDSELTANDARYSIEWQMVTAHNQQVNFVEQFDMRDVTITQSESRELKSLVLSGDPFKMTFRVGSLPHKATVRLIIRGQEQNPVGSATFDQSLPPGAQGDLKWVKDGDSYVLYCDVPAGVTRANTAYMALWTIQETLFSMPTTEWNIVTAINTNLLPLMTSLRMMIDKFQKRLGRLQSYEDSDLLEYLSHGLRMVNLSYPTTSYNMNNTPDDLQPLVLMAAGWYGLNAQAILEADLSFNFSGQSVTLSVDRASQIDAAASKLMEMYNTQIGPAKMAYVRRDRGAGTVAGRGYSYRNMHSHVFRIASGTSNTLLTTLTKIGLL